MLLDFSKKVFVFFGDFFLFFSDFFGFLTILCFVAWVTWPERPKGAKDKIKMPEGQKAGPKGRQLEVGAQRAPTLLVIDIAAFL